MNNQDGLDNISGSPEDEIFRTTYHLFCQKKEGNVRNTENKVDGITFVFRFPFLTLLSVGTK